MKGFPGVLAEPDVDEPYRRGGGIFFSSLCTNKSAVQLLFSCGSRGGHAGRTGVATAPRLRFEPHVLALVALVLASPAG